MAIAWKKLAYADDLHAALTIDGTSPLSLSGQALSIKNNAVSPAAITAVDIGTIADSDTVIPSSKAVLTKCGLYLPLAGGTMSGNIVMPDGGTIGQAAGPLITFDDTNNYLEISGCEVGIGTTAPTAALTVVNNDKDKSYAAVIARSLTDQASSNIGVSVDVRDIATGNHANASYGMIFAVRTGDDAYNRTGAQYGVQGFAWHEGTGTNNLAIGGYFGARTTKAGGTLSNARCIQVQGGNAAGINATITNYAGIFVASINDSGTITTEYGIYISSPVGTNRYGIRIADVSGGSVNYAIYTGAGMVRIGGEFGCNGATPRASATLTGSAAASYDATTRNLINAIAAALKNNGICQ